MDCGPGWIGQVIPALTALLGVLVGTFGGEGYRRHRDAVALAAAFSGELGSLRLGLETLDKILDAYLAALDKGIMPRAIQTPPTPPTIYDANLQRIGILGKNVTEDLAFTYHMINAIRGSMNLALAADDTSTKRASFQASKMFIANALDGMPRLLASLGNRSSRRWLGVLP